MKYLTFVDQKAAQARSAEIATALGCGRKIGDITKWWFLSFEQPNTKQGALQIPDAEVTKLKPAEQPLVVDESVMKTAGWLPATAII